MNTLYIYEPEQVVEYLRQLDIPLEQSRVYIFLLTQGSQTVLEISRGLKIGRTKLYLILEKLSKSQLVVVHERHYGTSYEAQDPSVLEFLVNERGLKAENLKAGLPSALLALNQLKQNAPDATKIIEYKGVDGLKQINWNLTKAKNKYYVYELKNLDKHLSKHFSEKLRDIFATKQITSYDLTNNKDWKIETKVAIYKDKFSKARYIDPKIFKIEFETYVYNNCVALLSYEQSDIFGIEIYNAKFARQQKQLFEFLWQQAKKVQ